MAEYKVVVVTSGSNADLLAVDSRAAISHFLRKFPDEVEVIILSGTSDDVVKEYLEMAYPAKRFEYIASGGDLKASLVKCESKLQCPFILGQADTIVLETVPRPTVNWLGIAPVPAASRLPRVRLEDGFVVALEEPAQAEAAYGYIGVCGIADYQVFWSALSAQDSVASAHPLAHGLRALIASEQKMCGVEFTWATGQSAPFRERVQFLEDDRVITFFKDTATAAACIKRAELLRPFVPRLTETSAHGYAYKYIPGKTLAESLVEQAAPFYDWLESEFWKGPPPEVKPAEFQEASRRVQQGLRQRIAEYWAGPQADNALWVNGTATPPCAEILAKVEWDKLPGLPSRFHGDLRPEHVLVPAKGDTSYVLLDWVPDFGGQLAYGDRYYDLAQLYSGLTVPYSTVRQNQYSYREEGDRVWLDIGSSYVLQDARSLFEEFVSRGGYDLAKIRLLAALLILASAPRQAPPLSSVLHQLGKLELTRLLF